MMRKLKRYGIHFLNRVVPKYILRVLYRWTTYIMAFLRYGDHRFPQIINIEICGHCNRSCSYCPNVKLPQAARLIKEEVLQQILYRLKELKWHGVVDFIFFNESTLHPKLHEIVRRVKEAAPYCIPRISTNGDLLTEAKVKSYIDAGMDRIYVMRHNPTPEGWRENIESLAKKFPGIFVLMDIDELEATDGLHDFNGLVEVKKHRGRHIIKGKARCHIHRHVAQITIDGMWNLCCVDFAKTYAFGSLLKSSFLEIWHDPVFKKMRRNLYAGIPQTVTCASCTCLVERTDDNKKYATVPRASTPSFAVR